jgi:hypothetical protein
MPANTVSVTRPSEWGNPFEVGQWAKIGVGFAGLQGRYYLVGDIPFYDGSGEYIETTTQAVALYRRWIEGSSIDLSPLRGKNLACWCKVGEPCHADVLLELANSER